MNGRQAAVLEDSMRFMYECRGYGTELIGYDGKSIVTGLFSKGHEARICIGLVAEDTRSFSRLEELWGFDRQDLERLMVDVFERLDQGHGDPWLWDMGFDCLMVYEYRENRVLCRLHMDIDRDMEV